MQFTKRPTGPKPRSTTSHIRQVQLHTCSKSGAIHFTTHRAQTKIHNQPYTTGSTPYMFKIRCNSLNDPQGPNQDPPPAIYDRSNSIHIQNPVQFTSRPTGPKPSSTISHILQVTHHDWSCPVIMTSRPTSNVHHQPHPTGPTPYMAKVR